MARYIGPKSRIARRFGEPIFGADKVLAKRNFPPGQHGNNRRRKVSEYGAQLAEKQKAKYTYGVLERQFRNLFDRAAKASGITGEVLLQSLEEVTEQLPFSTETEAGLKQDGVPYEYAYCASCGGKKVRKLKYKMFEVVRDAN